jgi:GGDEF domain-containing protein
VLRVIVERLYSAQIPSTCASRVPREELAVAEPPRHLDQLPGVAHRLARRLDHLLEVLRAALRVAEQPSCSIQSAEGRTTSATSVVGVG